MAGAPGVFTISFDTELTWGSFDRPAFRDRFDSFRGTRNVVERLCALFEEYEIPATWAVVAHLLADCAGVDRCGVVEPSEDTTDHGDSWYEQTPCVTGVARDLWCAPDLIGTIRSCETPQEIALHGATHLVFGDHSRATAERELSTGVELLADAGIDAESFVYPRNRIAHVDLLAEYGIKSYRGRDARWFERRSLPDSVRKAARFGEELVGWTPPAVVPRETDRAVSVPGSQVFRPNGGGWQWTPAGTQAKRAIRGLNRAVETGSVFHLWCHPFNLTGDTEALLAAFERVLAHATQLRADGRLDVLPMQDVMTAYHDGRWNR